MVNSLFSEKFWSQQFSQITEEGIVSIWRKLKTIIRMFIIFVCSILVIPLVIIIRTIRPWYWIRFGWFLGSRIGHFSFDVENYLTEKKLGLHPKKGLDIFFYRWGKPANEFFSKIVKRHLFINNLANSFYTANNWIPGGSKHTILPAMVRSGSRDLDCLFRKVGPQLKFTREEIDIGLSFLRSIGMNENGKFVCLVARDSAYLSKDA